MNIPSLIKAIKTNKYSEVVASMDLPFLDINLAIWDAEDAGEIEIDKQKDRIKVLKDTGTYYNPEIADKILRACRHYEKDQTNLTIGRLNGWAKSVATEHNYPWHEYVMTLQYLIDDGQLIEHEITVPKLKDRPFNRFVFLCFPGNDNEEWNAREVNKFISNWKSTKVQ
jgi:hypothetical protein